MKHPILLSYFRKYMDFKTKIFISLIDYFLQTKADKNPPDCKYASRASYSFY